MVSIHAPRAEGDTYDRDYKPLDFVFQSTPPARRATDSRSRRQPATLKQFQSTPPARRATSRDRARHGTADVSIHAPRAEGDARSGCGSTCGTCFNPRPPRGGRRELRDECRDHVVVSIHAPRAEGDVHKGATGVSPASFQSTPPARRATWCLRLMLMIRQHLFQSTPPARRATTGSGSQPPQETVSIHAPRAEGDLAGHVKIVMRLRFQSTPPARRATGGLKRTAPAPSFQSTPPARRATRVRVLDGRPADHVSIHAPRAEGDRLRAGRQEIGGAFQSTPPARRATTPCASASRSWRSFQSTPPARRATRAGTARHRPVASFNPRPPRGGRPRRYFNGSTIGVFQSTPPARRATVASVPSARAALFQSTPPARRATNAPRPCMPS